MGMAQRKPGSGPIATETPVPRSTEAEITSRILAKRAGEAGKGSGPVVTAIPAITPARMLVTQSGPITEQITAAQPSLQPTAQASPQTSALVAEARSAGASGRIGLLPILVLVLAVAALAVFLFTSGSEHQSAACAAT